MQEQSKISRFEQTILPHADAAYNLARWLTRSDTDAEDVVQEGIYAPSDFSTAFTAETAAPGL